MRRARVQVGTPDESLTRFSGLAAVTELTERLGLVERLDAAVGPIKTTWLAVHKPVRSTLRALSRPLTGHRSGSRIGATVTAAARRASRPTAAGRP